MGGRNSSTRRARGAGETSADELRSVVLVGPSGAGKTTLLEHLLAESGAIPRAGTVADGTCVGDHDPSARRLGRSVSLAVASLRHREVKIDLVDTPGCPDFVGELRAGLRAADGVLFVVDATDATDVAEAVSATDGGAGDADTGRFAQTSMLWRECVAAGLPAVVVLTRADAPRADADAATAGLAVALGQAGAAFVVTHRRADAPDADAPVADAPDADATPTHDVLAESVETLIERAEDEALLERWISGEAPSPAELRADLARAMATGPADGVVPVLPVAALARQGLPELIDLVVDVLPAPAARPPLPAHDRAGAPGKPIRVDPDGPLVAEIVHTGLDAQGSRVSLLRVFSGTLRPDTTLAVLPAPRSAPEDAVVPAPRSAPDDAPRTDDTDADGAATDGAATDGATAPTTSSVPVATVRVARLHAPLGGALRELDECRAGDLCAVTRLSAATGDTLIAVDAPAAQGMDMWDPPEALLPVAVSAGTGSSAADSLARGLARLAGLEPGLRIERNPETHQVVLWCTGDIHADVLLDRLRAAGAAVEATDMVVPLRETVAGPASALGRHVKQSGGHGQFAVCRIEVEPLPCGSGVEFVDKIVGGVIPRAYIPGVEKGVRDQLAAGVHDGRPIVDVRVTLVDGKAHSVDSSDQAFQTAGALAVREAVAASGTVVLEPLDDVVITVDDDRLGAVLGDLAARHGRVLGTEPDPVHADGHHTRVLAEVPETALVRYPVDLGMLTGGTARFTRRFGRYDRASSDALAGH